MSHKITFRYALGCEMPYRHFPLVTQLTIYRVGVESRVSLCSPLSYFAWYKLGGTCTKDSQTVNLIGLTFININQFNKQFYTEMKIWMLQSFIK